jgi:hypothetical protein
MATAPSPAAPAHPDGLGDVLERALFWTQLALAGAHHTCDKRARHITPHPGRCIACWLGRADKSLTRAAELAR